MARSVPNHFLVVYFFFFFTVKAVEVPPPANKARQARGFSLARQAPLPERFSNEQKLIDTARQRSVGKLGRRRRHLLAAFLSSHVSLLRPAE